ncbi:hypothetical protein AKJ40_03890 [candidate division MSBL1 archaeon SCGC-AAA259M10]|uniref:HTH asnC-type domain-containing protein n=1 Tax=candidate division MSBL1 archaeon SCGC-AAA259M10 TaxID=1698270 RepID=A0A133UY57_9EURY|nr:hypothetical protein AKJ40_03890 [candidate division MSBL1 archaeon SCGC-AAA259M10]
MFIWEVLNMDEINRKILNILRKNSRTPYVDIAERLEISEGTVRNRVKKMQSEGIIDRFTIELGEAETARAFVMVNLSTDTDISELVKKFPEDSDTFEVAGDYDLIAEIRRKNTSKINEAVDAIRSLNGLTSTKTYMVLNKPRT